MLTWRCSVRPPSKVINLFRYRFVTAAILREITKMVGSSLSQSRIIGPTNPFRKRDRGLGTREAGQPHQSSASDPVEMNRLFAALLNSISHDLRTPLSSILGSATTLSSCGRFLDETTKCELISTIQGEAELLNRFISNLLSMTRLHAGDLQLHTSPLELSDAIGSVLRRAGKILAAHRTEVRLNSDLTMLDVDAVLFEQVLFNLVDNAAKYAPEGSLVVITAWQEDNCIQLQVLDEGPGIPPCDLSRVFQKFFRSGDVVHRCKGTGLGLAICLGFIEAMRGTITAANRRDRQGAVFTITLPCQRQQGVGRRTRFMARALSNATETGAWTRGKHG